MPHSVAGPCPAQCLAGSARDHRPTWLLVSNIRGSTRARTLLRAVPASRLMHVTGGQELRFGRRRGTRRNACRTHNRPDAHCRDHNDDCDRHCSPPSTTTPSRVVSGLRTLMARCGPPGRRLFRLISCPQSHRIRLLNVNNVALTAVRRTRRNPNVDRRSSPRSSEGA